MNKERVLEIAQKKLVDIQQVNGSNVLRGKYQVKNSIVAIYYLDYSTEPIVADKLLDFQEKLISTDYYNDSGFLQWNYYLLFIRDSIDLNIKKEIEQNDIYSRKFILSPIEFESFFRYEKVDEIIKEDIVIKWKEALRNANLHEVMYRKSTYVGAVDRFINGEVQKEELLPNSSSPTSTVQIKDQHIQQLELKDNYRPFPLARIFEFSTVNLIDGVNGVGKTSLLEAIELVLCGKSDRYSQTLEPQGSISIAFKGGPIESFTPRDNAKFQLRDANWYNNTYTNRNYLSASFNRYNYFNAEASYKINSVNSSDYKELLSSIALGQEYSFITERLKGFQNRLKSFESDFMKRKQDGTNRISEAKQQQEQLDKSSDPQALFEKLEEFLKSILWNKESLSNLKSDHSKFETDLSKVLTALRELTNSARSTRLDTFEQVKDDEKKLKDSLEKVIRNLKALEKSNVEISDLQMRTNEIELSLNHLHRLEEYCKTKESLDLVNISAKTDEIIKDINFLKDVNGRAQVINWEIVTDSKSLLKELKNQAAASLAENREAKSVLEKRLSSLKETLDRLGTIESEIKALGKEYIEHNHDAKQCPLCSTKYTHEELSRRITEIRKAIRHDTEISAIQVELKSVAEQIKVLEEKSKQLLLIEALARLVFETDISLLNVEVIRKKLVEFSIQLSGAENRLAEYSALTEKMKSKGLTEEDLKNVITKVSNPYPSFNLIRDGEIALNSLIQETVKQKEILKSEFRSSTENYESINKQLQEITSSLNLGVEIQKIEEVLKAKIQALNSSILYFTELQKFIDLTEKTSFIEVDLQVKQAESLYKGYVATTQQVEQVKVLQSIIQSTTTELSTDVNPKLKRIQDGLHVIDEILNQDEKDKVLKEFFESNDEQIQDIFKRIHTPRELDKVLFFGEGNSEIKILRTNGKQCSINEISSGQRSALALSIFLTLNKKLRNGPNLLLFDDPVAFVDEMNILSFLDYLREIVINEDRQIFFATANQKLASFFDKKFSFLKTTDDYKYIALRR